MCIFLQLSSLEKLGYVNEQCVCLESGSLAASLFSVWLILLLPHREHYSYYLLATTFKDYSTDPVLYPKNHSTTTNVIIAYGMCWFYTIYMHNFEV